MSFQIEDAKMGQGHNSLNVSCKQSYLKMLFFFTNALCVMYYLIKTTTVIWDLGVLGDIYAPELKYVFFFFFALIVIMAFKTNKQKSPAAQISSYIEKYC